MTPWFHWRTQQKLAMAFFGAPFETTPKGLKTNGNANVVPKDSGKGRLSDGLLTKAIPVSWWEDGVISPWPVQGLKRKGWRLGVHVAQLVRKWMAQFGRLNPSDRQIPHDSSLVRRSTRKWEASLPESWTGDFFGKNRRQVLVANNKFERFVGGNQLRNEHECC